MQRSTMGKSIEIIIGIAYLRFNFCKSVKASGRYVVLSQVTHMLQSHDDNRSQPLTDINIKHFF